MNSATVVGYAADSAAWCVSCALKNNGAASCGLCLSVESTFFHPLEIIVISVCSISANAA